MKETTLIIYNIYYSSVCRYRHTHINTSKYTCSKFGLVKLNQFETLLPNESCLTGLKLGVAKGRLKFLHSILSLKPLYKTEHQAEVKTHVQRRMKMRRDFTIVVYNK